MSIAAFAELRRGPSAGGRFVKLLMENETPLVGWSFLHKLSLWNAEDARAADLLQEYEAKIAALERMVGRQALEIEFLKGALKSVPRPRSASTSVFTGPTASPSPKDAA